MNTESKHLPQQYMFVKLCMIIRQSLSTGTGDRGSENGGCEGKPMEKKSGISLLSV